MSEARCPVRTGQTQIKKKEMSTGGQKFKPRYSPSTRSKDKTV